MAGLKNILKMYGKTTVNGVVWLYDYANDEAVKESDMPQGSERHKASEKAKYEQVMKDK